LIVLFLERLFLVMGLVCGVIKEGGVVCWGSRPANPGVSAVSGESEILASGRGSGCGLFGVREDSHEVECWGNIELASIPKGSGFLSIASSDYATSGVREVDFSSGSSWEAPR